MKRYVYIALLCVNLFSCSKNDEQRLTNKDITQILTQAEHAILNHQGIETDSMMKLRMEYYHKAKTFNDSVHMYRSHFYLGSFYKSRGIYDEAMREYDKALQHISADKDSARYIQTKIAIATTEIELGSKHKAADILLYTYKIAQRNNDVRQLLDISGNMGILNLELKKYNEAKQIFSDAITFIEEENLIEKKPANYIENYINYHMFLAKTYYEEEKHDSSMLYIDRALLAADFYKDIEGKAYLYQLKGRTQTAQKRFEEAYDNLTKGNALFETLKNEKQRSKMLFLLADNYVQQGAYVKAQELLNSLETRYTKGQVLVDDYHETLLLKADIFKNTKQFKKESEYRQKSETLQDSMNANTKDETMIQTATQYEIEKIKNQFEAQQQKDEQKFYTFLSIAILVIVTFGFLLFKQLQKRKTLKTTEESKPDKTTSQNAIKSDKTVDEILQKLTNLEAQEFYLNPKYNLYATAKKIDTNTTYLSNILNTYKKMTFTEYLNTLRIDYTLHRLENDKKFRMYTIKAMAKEVGYKSHGSFSRAFKAKTGENPSTYLKKIR
ncbi:helix-turn-helix domain-containing protein [Kordia jejudonensis]|uniref:helix-turn-helix domain-containing protein n=1 Tax=Kordia jejudonensis TaxID=1348245 RepID=UPI0006291AF9|nr:helix-turn-helix domain-containing protein [Kordia jejudonensis]